MSLNAHILGACAALVFSAASAAARVTWTRQSPLPYAPQLNPDEIAFSATRGYLVGANTLLHETTDGGVTWHERVISGPVANLDAYYGVSFFGPTHGWLVGDNLSWSTSCFRTTDGGATWTQMSILENASWSHVDFVSTTRGWVGAWGLLYVTSDGGASWSPQNFGVSTPCGFDGLLRRERGSNLISGCFASDSGRRPDLDGRARSRVFRDHWARCFDRHRIDAVVRRP